MIFVFDNANEHGVIPNLIKEKNIVPRSQEWWDLAINAPYSYEFRFLKYLSIDGIYYEIRTTDEIARTGEDGTYPIHLNFFDSEIDYFSLISEQALTLCRNRKLTILFYYSEGDDIESHIDKKIQEQINKYNIPRQQVKFVIANARVNKPYYYYFPDDELYYRYLNRDNDYVKEINLEPRQKKFTCLNRMDKGFRRIFAAHIWYENLHQQAFFSYTGKNYDLEFPTNKRKFENEWHQYWPYAPTIVSKFEQYIPFLCDDLPDYLHNNHKLIDKRFFEESYWNVVVETHINKNNLFLTEKTFKPILNLQPFIIVGSVGSLDLLKKLGYKTFNGVIDENYDNVENDELRLKMCLDLVRQISNWDNAKQIEIQQQLSDILLHNQQLLLSSKKYRLADMLLSVGQDTLA